MNQITHINTNILVHKRKNKKQKQHHTIGTVPKQHHTIGTVPKQPHTIGTAPKQHHTIGTFPESYRQIDIPSKHIHDCTLASYRHFNRKKITQFYISQSICHIFAVDMLFVYGIYTKVVPVYPRC
jgi:hypothetical protein